MRKIYVPNDVLGMIPTIEEKLDRYYDKQNGYTIVGYDNLSEITYQNNSFRMDRPIIIGYPDSFKDAFIKFQDHVVYGVIHIIHSKSGDLVEFGFILQTGSQFITYINK